MKQITCDFLKSIGFEEFEKVEDIVIQLSIGVLIATIAITVMCIGSIFD